MLLQQGNKQQQGELRRQRTSWSSLRMYDTLSHSLVAAPHRFSGAAPPGLTTTVSAICNGAVDRDIQQQIGREGARAAAPPGFIDSGSATSKAAAQQVKHS
jgi:hypothetical protein